VTRALSGHTSIDHVDGQLVVATPDGRAFGWKAKISHDGTHVPSMLGGTAATAARNSASVEPAAVMDCVLHW